MQQPDHDIRIQQTSQATPRRVISLALVGVLHVILIYALASGLAQSLVKKGLDEIKVATVEDKPIDKPPPPPPPKLEEPPPPFVPPPDIVIETAVAPPNAITTQNVVKEPPPAPRQVISTPVSIGRAHTCVQNYPALSQRLQEEGTATLSFTINTDGSVSNPSVTKSSGYPRLDDAAMACVPRWKYKPATQDGQPVATQWQAAVQFKLH
jgi:protein TonB